LDKTSFAPHLTNHTALYHLKCAGHKQHKETKSINGYYPGARFGSLLVIISGAYGFPQGSPGNSEGLYVYVGYSIPKVARHLLNN
jgi:hypothetical protein